MKKTKMAEAPRVDVAAHIQPKNINQDRFMNAIREKTIVIGKGSAGTGKTFCAVNMALNLFFQGKIKKIILTRPNVPTGRTLGLLPGTLDEKLTPWLMPMITNIKERTSAGWFDTNVRNGNVTLQPLEMVRGCSWDRSIIICDEAQNLNLEEIKALTTRLGKESKLVLIGDPSQKDTRGNDLDFIASLYARSALDIPVVTFTVEDIVRSDIVGQLVKLYEEENI